MKKGVLTVTLNEMQEKSAGLTHELAMLSRVEAVKCYQCGKCTAGCPAAEFMDIMPNQVMRLVQQGLVEEALNSKAIWICATCETCSCRCPRNVDITHVMETLRIMAKHKGIITEKDIDKFHNVFLQSVKNHGRVYEVGLIVGRNLTTGKLFRDVEYGVPYLAKRKVHLLPESVKAKDEVQKIFERAARLAEQDFKEAENK